MSDELCTTCAAGFYLPSGKCDHCDAARSSLAPATGSAWTQNPPTEQGTYWHWNGDEDCAPLPMFVLWSGHTGKCFVSMGQLGIEHAIDCDQYGGWWMPLYAPPLPNVKISHATHE